MENEDYQNFLKTYKECIVGIIENGYLQEFEEGEIQDELKSLWQEIY